MTLTFPFNTENRRKWSAYTAETVLLGLFFATVPPFLAIGLYFCFWHSLRHIARIILIDTITSQTNMDIKQFGSGFLRFMKLATPLTLVSLAFLAALYLIVPSNPDDLLSLIALYLVLISALTLPHSLIVLWMDKVQDVWRSRRKANTQDYTAHDNGNLQSV